MSRICWLICPECGTKEWVTVFTAIEPCLECGSARRAEDDDGNPLVLFSQLQDATNFNVTG